MAVAVISPACDIGPRLDLEIVNDSSGEAVLSIRAEEGIEVESTRLDAGERESINIRRGSAWSVWVNDRMATWYQEWPSDNPTIDLTIYVHPDGTVEVIDT
jgi:hypothetical protein